MTEIIFAVLFVSLMGLTRCYKTTVFLHLLWPSSRPTLHEANEDHTVDVRFMKPVRCGSSDARTISDHDLSVIQSGAGFECGFSSATPPVSINRQTWSSTSLLPATVSTIYVKKLWRNNKKMFQNKKHLKPDKTFIKYVYLKCTQWVTSDAQMGFFMGTEMVQT